MEKCYGKILDRVEGQSPFVLSENESLLENRTTKIEFATSENYNSLHRTLFQHTNYYP